MGDLFGTDGIRGVANVYPMTAETALAVGRATAHLCRRHGGRHRIVIGKDTRLSGYMLETALTAGICSMGVDVLLVGPMPTPGIAFITRDMRADAGIVISASHNPYQDNGIKIFSWNGYKLSDEIEREIEKLMTSDEISSVRPTADEIGKAQRIDDAIGRYTVFCKTAFPGDLTLEGLKLVLDCGNGATYHLAPIIFSELGAEVTAIHDRPNGRNINDQCGSQFTDDLVVAVKDTGAHAGLAFDGDGDRLTAVDENGRELTGDHILAICAKDMKDRGILRNNLLIVTPMSNLGMRLALDELGIIYEDADVGDKNVLELMQKRGASIGGEQSGHVIFLDHHTTGDGIITALQLLAVMQRTGEKLSTLAEIFKQAPQILINVEVSSKPALEDLPELQEAIAGAETGMAGKGRVLIRYSGTQNLCRVMVEGPTEEQTHETAESLAAKVRELIG
ncbi:MAG: phosphoglucosamine mutase [Kiritimatiellia bacterium]|jgi:phosphoglucosamine mutase|nr:phosphoglucosamine mutase [Kiritimatiellia bacterium]